MDANIVEEYREIHFTIVPQFKLVMTNDGMSRLALFLLIFIFIHAGGNFHVYLGPDDFNGYGFFYVILSWTVLGFGPDDLNFYGFFYGLDADANIVEEYRVLHDRATVSL